MQYRCKGCTERFVGCHATCKKYIEQKAEDEKRKAEFRKELEAKYAAYETHLDGMNRTMESHRHGKKVY